MNPWQTQSSTVMYDNPWIRVTEHKVLNPKGNPGIYGTVHFKGLATGIVPLDKEGNTWLVGQWRYALERYSWEIPEGGGPLDVEPLVTAKRELLEETGIVASNWQPLLQMHLSNSVSDEVGYLFVARGLTFSATRPDDTEEIALWRLPFAEAYALVLRGEITDAMSVAGILKLQLMLQEGSLKPEP